MKWLAVYLLLGMCIGSAFKCVATDDSPTDRACSLGLAVLYGMATWWAVTR